MFTKFNAAALAFAFAALLYACADVPWSEPPAEHIPADPEVSDGGHGGGHPVEESDAGVKPTWCDIFDTGTSASPACESCDSAPAGEPWCSDASPCSVIGMAAIACGWSTPVASECIEVGGYVCGEAGRMVCCPNGGPVAVNPACVSGPQDCIDFGPCIAAYCAPDGSCAYGVRAWGAPCGAGGACTNGICFQ